MHISSISSHPLSPNLRVRGRQGVLCGRDLGPQVISQLDVTLGGNVLEAQSLTCTFWGTIVLDYNYAF